MRTHNWLFVTVRKVAVGISFLASFAFALFSGFSARIAGSEAGLQGGECGTSVICPGEDLAYEVTFFNFHLGQVRLKTFPTTRPDGRQQYNAAAYVDSYEGVPFVDLHTIEHTRMDSAFNSMGVVYLEKKDDGWFAERTYITPSGKRLVLEKGHQSSPNGDPEGPIERDTLVLRDRAFQDGLSIFYFARANIRENRNVTVPTIVYGKAGRTKFYFRSRSEYKEIDALPGKKIRVVPLEGKAEFKGVFGLTGDFKGWFTDDAAAVPIKAEVKVLIGSIDVELTSWKRSGWDPPE